MVGAISMIVGEVLFQAVRFIIMLVLLIVAVFIGGKLRKTADARKAKKLETEKKSEIAE